MNSLNHKKRRKKLRFLLHYFFLCCLDLLSAGLGSAGFTFFTCGARFGFPSLTSIDSLIELAS
jgi:hypothetical protein